MKGEPRFICIFILFLSLRLSAGFNWGDLWGTTGDYIKDNFGFSEYCKPTPEALGVYNGSVKNEQMTAIKNSWARQREPFKGRLYYNSAWQAESNDYLQYLQIDLLTRHVLMAVASQGMRGSLYWVTQYKLLYSNDGKRWQPVTEKNGEPKLFVGNTDSDTVRLNVLEFPIVARYIKINPQRWNGFIAMRVELYGCKFASNILSRKERVESSGYQASFKHSIIQYTFPKQEASSSSEKIHFRFRTSMPHGLILYLSGSRGDYLSVQLYASKIWVSYEFVSHQAQFAGKGMIQYDLTGPQYQVRTRNDYIRLRFRTRSPFGAIFYASSSQGDFISIELYKGILKTSFNLGTGESDIYAGSLLDDNQWHDVDIIREARECNVTIDRLKTIGKLKGEFLNLDIDSKLNLGGLSTFTHVHGLITKQNFTGCLENFYFNDLNMIRDIQDRPIRPRYRSEGVTYKCHDTSASAVTFHSSDAMVEFSAQGDKGSLRVVLTFRTYNPDGIMVYYKQGSFEFQIKLDKNGYLQYTFTNIPNSENIEDIVKNMDEHSESQNFNNGLWHTISLRAQTNEITFTVDRQVRKTSHPVKFENFGDGKWIIGAGPEGYKGYLGCMQNIEIGTKSVTTDRLKQGAKFGANVGSCSMRDRCHPNPCAHGGRCSQDWATFYCNCEGTGYSGEVCHRSAHFQSCTEAKETNKDATELATKIDVDGSGPLEPFKVVCDFKDKIKTRVLHRYMKEMLVDGFQDPGSYRREIIYDANRDQLTAMIERASSCQQSINFKCKAARLLAKPGSPFDKIMGWGWWVGRTKQPMYYWGGASPGTYKCACGVSGNCENNQERCNCDAGDELQWKSDDGLLLHKEYLPVMELRLGDTGTLVDNKQAMHKLGPLECFGDALYSNAVTFRREDATLGFPPLQFDEIDTLDIKFQFRTMAPQGTFIHATGDNQFIEISYNSGTIVQFRFNVGRGVESIEVISPSKLNDGNIWHTVTIERNRKQNYLKIDMLAPSTKSEPVNQGYKNFWLKSNFTVGATIDFRNGFVGCMRGLQVNGELFDLRGQIARNESVYGLSEGCVPKCASNPCINNGLCKEGFSHYECDCTFTPWRGYICGREVGTNLGSGDMIKYLFDSKGSLATEEEVISVGFATQEKKGILMKIINPDIDEYISLELNNNGGITVTFNFGAQSGGRQTISTDNLKSGVDLTNNQPHTAHFRREKGGRRLVLQVDEYDVAIRDLSLAPGADTKLNGPKFIYMGRDENTKTGEGFTGCIYRAKFNNIYPLKLAFNAPRPSNIILSPNDLREDKCGFEEVLPDHEPIERRPEYVNISLPELGPVTSGNMNSAIIGDLKEDTCGFEEVLAPPETYEYRTPPHLHKHITYVPPPSKPGAHVPILSGVLAAIFLILLIIIAIVAYNTTKQKGAYKTKEAKGTEGAENPDFAILQGQTGQPEVSRKREVFI